MLIELEVYSYTILSQIGSRILLELELTDREVRSPSIKADVYEILSKVSLKEFRDFKGIEVFNSELEDLGYTI